MNHRGRVAAAYESTLITEPAEGTLNCNSQSRTPLYYLVRSATVVLTEPQRHEAAGE